MQLSNTDKLVVSVLSDAILFNRIARSMYDIVNAVNLNKGLDFDAETQYNGISNAIQILGITADNPLSDKLCEIYIDLVEEIWNVDPKELAERILIEWTFKIREHYTSTQTAS